MYRLILYRFIFVSDSPNDINLISLLINLTEEDNRSNMLFQGMLDVTLRDFLN